MWAAAVLLIGLAFATPQEDLTLAANAEAPESVRLEAFDRLVRAGATNMALVSQTATDPEADTRARWVSIRALGMVRGDRARGALVSLLDDPQPAIRAATTQALGDLGDRQTAGKIAAKLQDPAIIVRAAAAEALGKLAQASTVPALSQALLDRDNFYRGSSLWVRRHYVDSLGQIGSRDAIPALLRALEDADPLVSNAAVGAFEDIAGFSYAEGRDLERQREAWRRWAQAQL